MTNIPQHISVAHSTTSVHYWPYKAAFHASHYHIGDISDLMVVLYSAGVQLPVFKLHWYGKDWDVRGRQIGRKEKKEGEGGHRQQATEVEKKEMMERFERLIQNHEIKRGRHRKRKHSVRKRWAASLMPELSNFKANDALLFMGCKPTDSRAIIHICAHNWFSLSSKKLEQLWAELLVVVTYMFTDETPVMGCFSHTVTGTVLSSSVGDMELWLILLLRKMFCCQYFHHYHPWVFPLCIYCPTTLFDILLICLSAPD